MAATMGNTLQNMPNENTAQLCLHDIIKIQFLN